MINRHTRRNLLQLGAATLAGAAFLAGTALTSGTALAQGWPDRPITLVVPFPPGGSTDVLARQIAEQIAGPLGQPVVVENRGGAGGTVGANHVAQSAPDGYTLLMGVTGSNAISGVLRSDLPYDPGTDFAPVALVVSSPLVLTVHADSDIHTLDDFIAAAAAEPEAITHGTPGVGTSMHLAAELFGLESGTSLLHVPYQGSAAAIADLLGGSIDAMFADILVASEYIAAGRLRPLGVTGDQEHFMLEGVPTIDTVLPGYFAASWQGVFAPAGTDPAILERLHAEISTAMTSDTLQTFFRDRGFLVEGRNPDNTMAFITEEIEKWGRVVEAAGISVD
ncbi:MAG: tripartite tricarboxylate transporter substrate binding protein [Pararhodobacter sp.]|nr:tripartite tricarboxylate transporter substrate binding protein [Pararhodobacter sp.]